MRSHRPAAFKSGDFQRASISFAAAVHDHDRRARRERLHGATTVARCAILEEFAAELQDEGA
jgi:hypothetical protein